jgi:hypothetical protein
MTSRHPLLRVAFVVCLSTAASGLHAQTATAPYEPEIGQAGKDVVWVPTPQPVVEKMLDLAQVTAADYVIDLGSGDGRTVITAAKRGARAMGVEYEPGMVELSQRNAIKAGVADRATFVKADLFETDFSSATVLTMFLLPDINLKLRPKLLELKPGTRVVSNSFSMGEWTADDSFTVDDNDCSSWCTALLWIVPARLAGTWRLPDGSLTLAQEFQMVSGTLATGGRKAEIAEGRIRGEELTFTVEGALYTGRLRGDVLEGTVEQNGAKSAWRAERARQAAQ